MTGKIAVISYDSGAGRTLVTGQLFRAARNKGLSPKLIGYDVEKQDWLSSELLENPIVQPVEAMVPAFNSDRCNFCGNCLRFCSRFAIRFDRAKPKIQRLPDHCNSCGECLKGCSHNGIELQSKLIGNIYRSCDNQIYAGKIAKNAIYIHPLFFELNKLHCDGDLTFCDMPPGDSGFVTTSLEGINLAILIVIPTPGWEEKTQQMLDYIERLNLKCCILANKADTESDFYKDLVELSSDKKIPVIGAIAEMKSNSGIDFQKEFQGSEVFQGIWDEINYLCIN
jgi:MinD superfamily P-loop ATPase